MCVIFLGWALIDQTAMEWVPHIAQLLKLKILVNEYRIQYQRVFDPVTRFHCASTDHPLIPLHDYLMRLARGLPCSKECFILALVLMDRVSVLLTFNTVHRLFLASLCLAVKTHEDNPLEMTGFSKLAMVPVTELLSLESTLWQLLNQDTFVPASVYETTLELVLSCRP